MNRFLPLIGLLLAACETTPDYMALSEYYANEPRTVLVLPAENMTTDAEAVQLFMSTISEPLVERGYYVFPMPLISAIFAYEGITFGQAWDVEPQKAHQYLGADAILYVTIHEWDTRYAVFASSVDVSLDYRMVDTRSGEVLFEGSGERHVRGGGKGQGLAGLIADAVEAGLIASLYDYVPLAEDVNEEIFERIPPGTYHPTYGNLKQELSDWQRTRMPSMDQPVLQTPIEEEQR